MSRRASHQTSRAGSGISISNWFCFLQLILLCHTGWAGVYQEKSRPAPASITSTPRWQPLSDYRGKIRHLLIQFSDFDPLPAYYDLFRKLDHTVRITVLVPDIAKKELLQNLLNQWRISNTARVEIAVVHGPVTPWARDPFMVQTAPGGATRLVFRKYLASLRNLGDDPVLKKELAKIKIAGHTPQLITAPFVLDGGNLLSGGDKILVGNNAYFDNLAQELPSQEEYARQMQQVLGAEVQFVGGPFIEVPWGHSDMYLTLLGSRELLVGDPAWGAQLLQQQIQGGLHEYRHLYFDEKHLPLNGQARAMIFSDPLFVSQIQEMLGKQSGYGARLLPDLLERNRDRVLQRAFEQLLDELQRQGFTIHRLPILFNARVPMSPFLTYNNVLLEITPSEKRVYLPVYDLPLLDEAASRVYKKLGFHVRKISSRNNAFLLGAVRCLTNVLERGDSILVLP